MKKLSISLIALAALALGACTSDDIALNQNDVVGSEGNSYVSFAINLPTQTSTRAANDVFDDGLAAEYNVNDATLYLFEGTSEATAVYSQTISLDGEWNKYAPDDDNITVKQHFTEKVNKPSAGNNLYALVVINGAGVTTGTGAPVSIGENTTLASLQSTAATLDVATIANVSGANFYMTNAPLWHGAKGAYTDPNGNDSHGDASKVITLAEIDATKIYDTAAQAEDNPATEIYVERGVAKVTMSSATLGNLTIGDDDLSVTVDGFALDLTNLTGYPVRNTSTANEWWAYASGSSEVVGGAYRMVGNTEVGADLYRTYWALDPNYSTNMYTSGESGNRTYPTTVNSIGGTTLTSSDLTAADGETGAYCLENTFSVAHQNQDETTRAIVAVTLGTQGDFFTFEGNKSVLYTETQICNEVLALFAANADVQAAVDFWWQGLESEGNDIYSYYAASIDKSQGATHAAVDIKMATQFDETDFHNGFIPQVLTVGTDSFNMVIAAINNEHEFSYYAGGVAYYPVLIQHFGDELCPWSQEDVSSGTPAVSGDNGDSYPENVWGKSSEQNWLGRYGVLRNNWYDITVTSVLDLGSADVPTAYGEPDDPMYHWISVNINILSWAKRTQNVTLQ